MGDGVRVGGSEVGGLGEAVAEAEFHAHLGEDVNQARRYVRSAGNDEPQAAAEELGTIHLAEARQDVADTGDDDKEGRFDDRQFADGRLHIFAGEDEVACIEAAHSAGDESEDVAEGQDGDITVDTDNLAGLEDSIVVASHQSPVGKDSALRRAGGAAGEENGSGRIRVDLGGRNTGIGDGTDRAYLDALKFLSKRLEFIADHYGGDIELHTGTDNGHLGKGGREIHSHITGGRYGEEHLDSILAVLVEDGDVRSLGKSEAFNEGPAAGDSFTKFLIGNGVDLIGNGGIVCVLFREPVHELTHSGKVRKSFELLFREHVIKIITHSFSTGVLRQSGDKDTNKSRL